MEVIVANEQQDKIATLDGLDIVKSITGSYSSLELAEMFKNFFYSKMILDVTAIKNYNDIQQYRPFTEELDVDKIIFFIPEGSTLCTPEFLAKLVTLGIYNFTTNVDGVKYLLNNTNTYDDVAEIQKMGGGGVVEAAPTQAGNDDEISGTLLLSRAQPTQLGRTIKLGIKDVTEHAGSTSLIYMLKKELTAVYGEQRIAAIEVNKNDFQFLNDKTMISTTGMDLRRVVDRITGVSVILIDLNDFNDTVVCDDVLYLVEPSIIKLNRLIRKDKGVFQRLRDKKIILNHSLLSQKDVSELEYEAGAKVFFNLPPLNDRQRNEPLIQLLAKIGLVQVPKAEGGKLFGLFNRK